MSDFENYSEEVERISIDMGKRLEVEASLEGEMGKKSKTKKRSKVNVLAELGDCAGSVPNEVGNGSELSEEGKRKKRHKKKTEVSSAVKIDGTHNEDINVMDYAEMVDNYQKKKLNNVKKKIKLVDGKGKYNNEVDGAFKLSKEDNQKRSGKEKAEVPGDVAVDGAHDDENVQDYAEVSDNHQKEKKKKKKKMRVLHPVEDNKVDDNHQKEEKKKKKINLEPVGDNDITNNEIHMEGEEGRYFLRVDSMISGNGGELKVRKEKKRHKKDIMKDKNESLSFPIEILKDKDLEKNEIAKEWKRSRKDKITGMKNGVDQTKKKNKKRRSEAADNFKGKKKTEATKEVGEIRDNHNDASETIEKKKRKREEKKGKGDLGAGEQEMTAAEVGNESTGTVDTDSGYRKGNAHSTRNKAQDMEGKNGKKRNWKKPNAVETVSEDPNPKQKRKKVTFSDHVEVFLLPDDPAKGGENDQEKGLVQGKRFSREEDEMIKNAVFNYVESHGLGEEGLNMVLHCKSYPEVKDCWKEIRAFLPHRPQTAIYYRAHILFERAENRSWTAEELNLVRKFHDEHGPKWKELADALGKHRVHLKDAWRRIKLPNKKNGPWSQEEYQILFDLVNLDLRMRTDEEKKSKHGMLRDNISWSAISDKISTRNAARCCLKWYDQLTSPMVKEGEWADADDYRLVDELFRLDASCVEDVDWDYLLEHRSGDICRKRWKQMVSHLGEHRNKPFNEQVEILSQRYCPELLEAREAWDSKPVVP